MSWTTKKVAKLQKLWKNGETAEVIGKKLGFGKNAIVGKVHRLRKAGVDLPKRTSGTNGLRKSDKSSVIDFRPRPTGTSDALFERHHTQCKWPIGDPYDGDFSFCACKAARGSDYCAEHTRVAHDRSNDVSKYKKAA